MPKKKKSDETSTLTITIDHRDGPISGADYMQIESTDPDLPDHPQKRAIMLATTLVVAAGIQIGGVVKNPIQLAELGAPIVQAFLTAATKRLDELHPESLKTVLEENNLAEKLGVSNEDLQEMKELLRQKIG